MSEPLNTAVPAATAAPQADQFILTPAELAKLKDLLKTLGHDVEAVWDTAVSLVKKAK
ncbi:hypothetical protein [Pantoea vagans]|uniref:hypothetical protein n=1 Tax=Pantoea vagans TaxID=470934 RepID=UPI0023AEAD5E|nr:hypothetical protein [Pantoea vagans]MDE8556105.1 hypothetical protein [Pantoea vagans]MDE8576156.1 hypothetical protein [Pantoea vagans]